MKDARDAAFLEMAYGLAAKGRGLTSPNPTVGAVVVRAGRVVGWGYHERAGGPHAEILALGRAGDRARGATLYVTLEPCVHWGRTPPCIDAVRASGVRRVVVSARDPNPRVDGRGIARLRRSGIEVSAGLFAERHAKLNAFHTKFITRHIPWVTLKAALAADGKIAAAGGDSRWITSVAARDEVHLLRGEYDAILVGIGTALRDDPRLTVRHAAWGRRPLRRVVLDSRLRLPLEARLLASPAAGRPLIFAGPGADAKKAESLRRKGAEVVAVGETGTGLDLGEILLELGKRDIVSVLIEGGGRVFTSFLSGGLADGICLMISPRLVGGAAAPGLWEGGGAARISKALSLRDVRVFRTGPDIVLEGYL